MLKELDILYRKAITDKEDIDLIHEIYNKEIRIKSIKRLIKFTSFLLERIRNSEDKTPFISILENITNNYLPEDIKISELIIHENKIILGADLGENENRGSNLVHCQDKYFMYDEKTHAIWESINNE